MTKVTIFDHLSDDAKEFGGWFFSHRPDEGFMIEFRLNFWRPSIRAKKALDELVDLALVRFERTREGYLRYEPLVDFWPLHACVSRETFSRAIAKTLRAEMRRAA